jgi:DNA-directed RNA polymerase subunit H (RpoH/RPB5)
VAAGGGRLKKTKKTEVKDVLNYFLNPKVEVLSEKEKEAVLKKFHISEDKLPKIKKDDPLAKALNLEKGQVIKITRDDGTGSYVYYRICI